MCHFGERLDLIRITLFIDGIETKEVIGYGRTHCDQWIVTDAARIQSAKYSFEGLQAKLSKFWRRDEDNIFERSAIRHRAEVHSESCHYQQLSLRLHHHRWRTNLLFRHQLYSLWTDSDLYEVPPSYRNNDPLSIKINFLKGVLIIIGCFVSFVIII